MSDEAKKDLEHGAKYPYDAPDDHQPSAATDWAHVGFCRTCWAGAVSATS